MWSASAGDGPISMPSASMLSSRARPNSSTRVVPAEASASRGVIDELGLHVQHEPVEVGALLDAGRLDAVRHLEDRRVDGIHRDAADLRADDLVRRGRHVAAATLHDELDLELALLGQGRELEVRVVHGDAGRRRDVRSGDLARALLAQVHRHGLVVLGRDDQILQVQDQLGHVLLDAGHGGELVQHAVDANAGDARARDGRQQRAAQGVAEGVAEARLQRLDHEPGPVVRDDLLGQGGALRNQHGRTTSKRRVAPAI